jgi:uncharacterized membrane protein HdeD (DUF308 family)
MLRRISVVTRQVASSGWWLLLLPQGVLPIALAALVLYEPAVLVHLAAAMLVIAGIFCIALTWCVRRIDRATTYWYLSE